jgi:hypothetical protein
MPQSPLLQGSLAEPCPLSLCWGLPFSAQRTLIWPCSCQGFFSVYLVMGLPHHFFCHFASLHCYENLLCRQSILFMFISDGFKYYRCSTILNSSIIWTFIAHTHTHTHLNLLSYLSNNKTFLLFAIWEII